jgi:hypothetical protein
MTADNYASDYSSALIERRYRATQVRLGPYREDPKIRFISVIRG